MQRLLMLSSFVILIDKKQNFFSEQCETSTVELGILVFQWSLFLLSQGQMIVQLNMAINKNNTCNFSALNNIK